MVGNIVSNDNMQELSIERACQEYNSSVRLTLTLIGHQLEANLNRHYESLEELAEKIETRTSFLERNPTFLSCLTYNSKSIRSEPLREFDVIKITLKNQSEKIVEILEKINKLHTKLFDLVSQNNPNPESEEIIKTTLKQNDYEVGNVHQENEEERTCGQTVETTINDPKNEEMSETTLKEELEISLKHEDDEQNKTIEEEEFEDCVDETIKNNKEIKPNTSLEIVKMIETPQKKESIDTRMFDRVMIQKNAFSDMSLNKFGDSSVKFQLFPDLPADVQRRKPFEDLHGRLIQQLEASDSLEGFLKLMDRKPTKCKIKQKKGGDGIEEKYTGSLWFFPHKGVKRKMSKSVLPTPNPPQKSAKIARLSGIGGNHSTCCNLLVTSSQIPMSNLDKTRKVREQLGRTKLKYYDLLDDLDGKDLKPIKSEYPRRDNIFGKEQNNMKLHEAKTYLHRMMNENEKVWKKLLQPITVKPEVRRAKKNVKNLMDYLTAPEQKFLDHIPQSLIVMPVKVIYDNFPTKELSTLKEPKPPMNPVLITDLTNAVEPPLTTVKTVNFTDTKPETPRCKHVHVPLNFKTEKKIEKKIVCPKPKPEIKQLRTDLTKPVDDPSTTNDRKKAMLENLKGLKVRNDNIQKNIQKAIDVIETKMIDLLSSPTDNTNSEAFNAMELEITNVLKMMNDSQGKVEKVEAEKDENISKSGNNSPKLKRGLTIVRKATIDLAPEQKKEETVSEKMKAKLEKMNDDEMKKAADIAAGEKILGQVDHVIKKIDNIKTKFYEENKQKFMKKDCTFGDVLDFLDGLKNIVQTPPIEIGYWFYEDVAEKFQEVRTYYEKKIYHDIRLEYPPQENLQEGGDFVKIRQMENQLRRSILKEEDKRKMDREKLHESTLRIFYTIFFSSVFVALNLDFAS